MAKLIFNEEEEVEVPDGSPIKQYCEEAGVPFACEEGICGTCVLEIEEGGENLSEFTQEESDFLGVQEKERLGCQCRIMKGTVHVRF